MNANFSKSVPFSQSIHTMNQTKPARWHFQIRSSAFVFSICKFSVSSALQKLQILNLFKNDRMWFHWLSSRVQLKESCFHRWPTLPETNSLGSNPYKQAPSHSRFIFNCQRDDSLNVSVVLNMTRHRSVKLYTFFIASRKKKQKTRKKKKKQHFQRTFDLHHRVFHGFLIRKQTSRGSSHTSCLTMEIKVFPLF